MARVFKGSILAVDETPTNGLVELTVLVPESALENVKEIIDNDLDVYINPED